MSTLAPLTESEVRQFVAQWYHKLDIHAPLAEFLAMVADEEIEFRFPEVTVTDKAGLTQWYDRVINTFFDEIHETKELTITTAGDRATVNILTQWQESTWHPPTPRSERQTFLAGQTWEVKRSDKTGQPVVVSYFVNSFDAVGGSGVLPVKDTSTSGEVIATTMDARTVIDTYYASVNRGDWDTWLTLFADNVVVDEQLAGHVEGIAILRGAVSGLKKGYSKFQNTPVHIVINGDEACAVSHISAANASGVPIEANVANYFRIEHGKIKYMANFHDTVPFAPFVNQKLD